MSFRGLNRDSKFPSIYMDGARWGVPSMGRHTCGLVIQSGSPVCFIPEHTTPVWSPPWGERRTHCPHRMDA